MNQSPESVVFDIGWTELVVIGVVMILVVGPKDLPGMLRSIGRTVRGLRRMAGDFQRQFDDALRDAELDDVKNLTKSKALKPLEDARKSIQTAQRQVTDTLNEKVSADTAAPEKTDTKAAQPKSQDAETPKPVPEPTKTSAPGKKAADKPKPAASTSAKKPAPAAKRAGTGSRAKKTDASA